ncbi:MAG TPA: glycerate kinase [Longimicrobiales bacterium]|nr:glycerate kinase [Longimicrobiales bacterium]
MILIAPTAFKETMSAPVVAQAMAAGVRAAVSAPVLTLPLSDGGPGLIDSIRTVHGGDVVAIDVTGPLGEPAVARLLRLGDQFILEAAEACGLHLVPREARNPLAAHTRGVGEMIRWAAQAGPSRIILGLGGSATIDGGAGMARALGWRLLDSRGQPIPDGGGGLTRLSRIEPPEDGPALPPVTVLVDVRNPLLGRDGAAPAFGPQKGADAPAIRKLARGLTRLADRFAADLGVDVRALRGGGAAGGLGAGAAAFLGASIEAGSDWVLAAVGFDQALDKASLLVTGEGEYDAQSGWGKIVGEVAARARRRGIPVLIIAGRVRTEPPEGVIAVDGEGKWLTEADVSRLVAREVRKLGLAAKLAP